MVTLPDGSPSPSFVVPLTLHTVNAAPPAFRFDNSEWALRWSGLVRSVDVALYYHHGFDISPAMIASIILVIAVHRPASHGPAATWLVRQPMPTALEIVTVMSERAP